MKMFHSLARLPLSFLVSLLSLHATAAPVSASTVLTPQNFNETISKGVWFIEHFSPYCPHCRHFEPTWNEVVSHFESMTDPGVHLAQVNCALNGDLCSQNGITGYPQMNLYRNGEFVDTFKKDREFHLLVEYLVAHAEAEGITTTFPETTEERPAPTPTPTPTPTPERLIVQTPRADVNPSGEVISLNVQTFDSFLSQGPSFIKFYAPWCGHCKNLAPTWVKLGRRMQYKVNIAEVDCDQHKALCTSQGVTAFPTMFFYAHGVKTEYTGGRSYDQLVSFADKASNPTMQVIQASELDQVVRDNPVMYLLLNDSLDTRLSNDVAKGAQMLLGSPPVYVSTSPELFRKYNIPSSASSVILAFKDNDPREPVAAFYPSSSQPVDAIKTWLFANRFPSSFELSKDVFQQVMYAPHNPLVVIVATQRDAPGDVTAKLNEIAMKWRLRHNAGSGSTARDVVFTWMDAVQWEKWMKDMYGIKASGEPEIVVADHQRLVYYDEDGSGQSIKLNSVSVASALEAILEGTARLKHSQNIFERAVRAFNSVLVGLEGSIAAHPYMSVCVIVGLAGAVFSALRSLFLNDGVDLEAEKRRLD